MKICAISDSHGQHEKLTIPECDVLIHAGDFSSFGKWNDTIDFLKWFSEQPAKNHILIAGNHDQQPFINFSDFVNIIVKTNIIYLQDDKIEIEGIKFYGSPWTPPFNDWFFMATEIQLKQIFSSIPKDIDVLITHGPARGILDQTYHANGDLEGNWGSINLKDKIKELKIPTHICGHLHDGYGSYTDYITNYYNVSVCDEFYKVVRQPTCIEI